MALYLTYAVRSDLGLVRHNNEDSVYAGPRLLAIADGMGGHAAGEVASKIVIGSLEYLDEDRRIDDLMGALRDSVTDANHRIAEAVRQDGELEGMGTTLTALRFVGSQVGLVHVGDSRAYLLRQGALSQITHDDTYVQYLIDSGKLTPEEAKDHPRKSVILRALLGSEVEPDVSIREAREGDRYLLCSDGLSDVVSTETILETLQFEDPQESADRLVDLALRGGGPDNVTVIVADVVEGRIGDRVNDVPIVAGAFVDPAAADVPGELSTPAERARALTSPPPAEPTPPPTVHRERRRWKPWALAIGIVVVIVAALGGVYAWTQTQYFVARADDDVAIYQGVNTEFGPLKFFTVYKVSSLRVSDLNAYGRGQVIAGITANSESDAETIVDNLRHQQKPPCPTATPTPTTTAPTTTAPTSPTTSARTSPTSTRSSTHTSTGRTGGSQSPPRKAATGHTKGGTSARASTSPKHPASRAAAGRSASRDEAGLSSAPHSATTGAPDSTSGAPSSPSSPTSPSDTTDPTAGPTTTKTPSYCLGQH